eukprot:655703-Heterocapsa_arctica.AAC.1
MLRRSAEVKEGWSHGFRTTGTSTSRSKEVKKREAKNRWTSQDLTAARRWTGTPSGPSGRSS